MIFAEYFTKVSEGIEFLIALGSIIGLLGLLMGFVILLAGYREKGVKIIVISFIIVAICGLHTGTKYFRI